MKLRRLTSYYLTLPLVLHAGAFGQDAEPEEVPIGGGVSLHYIERGEGEPIIFIHGLTGEYSVWTPQLEAFAREGFRAISYSRRYNHPNGNAPQPNHSAEVEAEDLAAFIRKLDIERAHIVGHSYGAYTALILALDEPELVRTLTLAEPPLTPWLSTLPGDQAEAGRARSRRLLREGVIPAREAFAEGDDELALRTMIDAIIGEGRFERLPGFVRQRCRRNLAEVKAVVTSRNAYPSIARDRVRGIEIPTLLLSGSETVATAKLTDPELERLLPRESSRRLVLEGTTHNMWVEQPDRCHNAVLELIRGE